MVGNQHEIAGPEVHIDATGCIRDYELADAKTAENPRRENDFRYRIPFIKVNPSLKGNGGYSFSFSDNQVARMSKNRGKREMTAGR